MRRQLLPALTVAAMLSLTGCISLAPSYERPPIELPSTWIGATGRDASTLGAQWWKVFGDVQLNRLVDEAFAHNTDLEIAVARVDEARALLGQSRSQQIPSLDAELSRSRTRVSLSGSTPVPPGTDREIDDYRAVLRMSYEIDLWGKMYNASKAARADVLASEAAQQTVKIALAADVVQNYFALRALDEQVAATQRSADARAETLTLQKARFDAGVISEFEYRQLEAEVLAARAQLPIIQRERGRQENAFSVLLGRSPKNIFEGVTLEPALPLSAESVEKTAPIVPGGLPSALLLRRPDLVEAEQNLIAANARIGVARAEYFPSISLTGFIGGQSAVLDDLFTESAETHQVAGSLLQPIFGIARANALTDGASARQRQALASYRKAIQSAFGDVRNAITNQVRTREQFDTEDQRANTLRETLRLAKLRYENGVASQLDVLDAERSLLTAELSRSDALRGQRAAIADLLKALGGSWMPDP